MSGLSGFRCLSSLAVFLLALSRFETDAFNTNLLLFGGEQRYLDKWMKITDLISRICEARNSRREYEFSISVKPHRLFMLIFYNEQYIPFAMTRAFRDIPRSPLFDVTKQTVIYIHGFNGYPDAIGVTRIGRGLAGQDVQFLSMDCRDFISGPDYLEIAGRIKYLGWILADFMTGLYRGGVSPDNIYVMGLSLGAQIGAYACKRFNWQNGVRVRRFTALDPTAQCFSLHPSQGIWPSDADYVDIIHTSVLSQSRNFVGHAEYYVNSRNGEQPGCGTLNLTCTHSRALHLYGDTIGHETYFVAKRCRNIATYDCQVYDRSLMGYGSSPYSRGNYVLKTRGEIPFGLGLRGIF